MKHLVRVTVLFSFLALLALTGCQEAVRTVADDTPPNVAYAMRWWNVLSPDQMVAALYGTTATAEQETAAKNLYSMLDDNTKEKVNSAAKEIRGDHTFYSVGAWWESLDCRKMRIAAGDGNTADPMSPYCAHYPGSGSPKLLAYAERAFVDKVGMALLGWNDPGVYPPDIKHAMRWWNVLNGEQMVAALYGSTATDAQAIAAKMMYADLEPETKKKVNDAAAEIYGEGMHDSVGAWWVLDCALGRW